MLLVETGDASTTTVETSEGTARRPLVDRRIAEYGALHSLALKRDTGVFTTVLIPHATAELPNVSVTRDDDELIVDHGHTVDRVGGSTWVRTTRNSAQTETLSWATGWRVRKLSDRDRPLLETSEEVDVTATVVDDTLYLEVTCTERCGLWIRPFGDILLNGVLVTAETADDGWAHLTLPYAGVWTVQGGRHD